MRREEKSSFLGPLAALIFLRRWRIWCSQEAGPAQLQGGQKAMGFVFLFPSFLSPDQKWICLEVGEG